MNKYILLAFIAALMGMGFIEPILVSVRLPQTSNVYPDTFAVYWQFDKRYTDDQKKNSVIEITIKNSFDDRLSETFEANDSLVLVPYNQEYASERALIVEPKVIKPIVTMRDFPSGYGHLLKIISKNDKIETLIALVRTSPRLTNLLILAEAYEEEKCFVNAFYIYKRIISLYPEKGKIHWQQFYKRHDAELRLPNGVAR